MKKTKNLKDLSQANGQKERRVTNLDQFFGMGSFTKYKTHDLEVYTNELNEMGLSQLQAHARDLGLMPIDHYDRLKKTLIEEFKSVTANFRPAPKVKINNNIKEYPERTQKILAENR